MCLGTKLCIQTKPLMIKYIFKYVNSKHGDIVLTDIAKIESPMIQFSNSITADS